MNNLGIRCCVFGMDVRREAQRMVIPFASFATPQTPEYTATLRAGAVLGACRCCEPLVVNDTTARLAPWPAPKTAPAYAQVIHLRALSPQESAEQCLDLMKEHRCRHLLVFDDEDFVGLVSLRDMVVLLMEEKEQLIDRLKDYIST